MESSEIVSYVCADVVAIVVTFTISTALVKFVQPAVQGFDCKNVFIMYPQRSSTISETGLLNSSLSLPTCFIVGLETIMHWKKKPQGVLNTIFALKLLNTIAVFYTAFNLQYFVGTSIKLYAGEPRPNFLEACKPNVDCSDPAVYSGFVDVYNCTTDKATSRKSRGGFISVKTSSITTSMAYISILTEVKWEYNEFFLGKLFLQFIFFSFAVFVAVSRVVDHEHNLADVILGFCLGIGTSFAAAHATNWFQQNITLNEKPSIRFFDDLKLKHPKRGHYYMYPTKGKRGILKHTPESLSKVVKKNRMDSVRKLSIYRKKHVKRTWPDSSDVTPQTLNDTGTLQ